MNKRLLYLLLGVNGVFIVLHFVAHCLERFTDFTFGAELTHWFSMDIEYSLPTWFATLLLLSIGAMFLSICMQAKTDRIAWGSLGVIFFYLSADELFSIHENLIEPMQELFGITSGPLFFAWVIPVFFGVVLLGIAYYRFLFSLPKKLRIYLFIAAGIFLLGAIGVEMISGAYWQAHHFENDMVYRALNALEEGLENMGSIIAVAALVAYKKKNKTTS
jgi:hypothetical protein